MSSRRTLILILSLALSGLSAFGIVKYVRGVEEIADAEQVTGTYWVVVDYIPKGMEIQRVLDEDMLVEVTVPLSLKPDTAVNDPRTELVGRVAIADLPRNTPILEGLFLTTDVIATGITERLAEKGMVTVTVGFTQQEAAAYQIKPGDFVNILSVASLTVIEDDAQANLSIDERTDIAFETNRDGIVPFANDARYVYQNAEVLAIDRTLTPQLGEDDGTETDGETQYNNEGLITFAVPPEAVQLILSVGLGDLYLSLVPQNYEPKAIAPIDIGMDLMPAEDPERLTPYGPAGIVEEEVGAE